MSHREEKVGLLKRVVKRLFPKQPKELEADVYFVSYPKSGRTWLRMLVGKYLQVKYELPEQDIIKTYEVTQRLPLGTSVMTHAGSGLETRLHWKRISYDPAVFDTKKVIFLGRDFKDTFVSSYYQATKRVNVFKGSIEKFARNNRLGIRKILALHDVWRKNGHRPAGYLHVTYEQMHADTAGVLTQVLEFMGESEVDSEVVREAVDYCAFSKMQKMEKQKKFSSSIMQSGREGDANSMKVRRGVVGGHKDELSTDLISYLDQQIKKFGF